MRKKREKGFTKKHNELKSSNAITLIALVVTIVVLLTLAGVSLSLILGENGIINKAKQAGTRYGEAKENEEIKMNDVTDWLVSKTDVTTNKPVYGDDSIEASNSDYFTYNLDTTNKTATITGVKEKYWQPAYYGDDENERIVGAAAILEEDGTLITDINIPYKVVDNGIEYTITAIGKDCFTTPNATNKWTSFNIPNTVLTIEEGAFASCKNLSKITISESVSNIESRAFSYCNNLSSIVVNNNNKVYDSRENCNAIIKKENNELIIACKNTKIPNSVKIIGESAFSSGANSTSIIIPNGVVEIKDFAFSYCNNITDIEIPDSVTNIGRFAFSSCKNLKSVKLPKKVTNMGNSIFNDCGNLTNVTMSEQIDNMGEGMFYQCRNLSSITIPDGITNLATCMFMYCSQLESITIPNTVTNIERNAFNLCTKLKNVNYLGTEEKWNSININEEGNEYLTKATVNYK